MSLVIKRCREVIAIEDAPIRIALMGMTPSDNGWRKHFIHKIKEDKRVASLDIVIYDPFDKDFEETESRLNRFMKQTRWEQTVIQTSTLVIFMMEGEERISLFEIGYAAALGKEILLSCEKDLDIQKWLSIYCESSKFETVSTKMSELINRVIDRINPVADEQPEPQN